MSFICADDIIFHLDFFSTFKKLNLPIHGPACVARLNEPDSK